MNFVAKELQDLGDESNLFDVLDAMEGEVYRELESRRTFRFEHKGKRYFAKLHFGVGWKEICKNLVQLRLPVLGANNEREAIRRLESLGIDTMRVVAYIDHGGKLAARKSCIVTEALEDTLSLEDLVLKGPVPYLQKRRLIHRVAEIAKSMHEGGVNHRDLYICHFHLDMTTLMDATPRLYVIDLHRAQTRDVTPRRWRVKDIGGLFFSVFDTDFTRRDACRFVGTYSGMSLRQSSRVDRSFWADVSRRAIRLYRDETGKPPRLGWIR